MSRTRCWMTSACPASTAMCSGVLRARRSAPKPRPVPKGSRTFAQPDNRPVKGQPDNRPVKGRPHGRSPAGDINFLHLRAALGHEIVYRANVTRACSVVQGPRLTSQARSVRLQGGELAARGSDSRRGIVRGGPIVCEVTQFAPPLPRLQPPWSAAAPGAWPTAPAPRYRSAPWSGGPSDPLEARRREIPGSGASWSSQASDGLGTRSK
jgi:hypothetical protein